VADSFYVVDGRTLSLERHQTRFLSSAAVRGFANPLSAERFWDAAIAAIPAHGEWFPRLELRRSRDDWSLVLNCRVAPPRSGTLAVATFPGRDPRSAPTIKGPDLFALPELRRRAQRAGADEYVFLHDGWIADGATTSLLWWRGDELGMPAEDIPRVAGTTAEEIVYTAVSAGARVAPERATPSDLEGAQLWAVNALHGIRLVTSWAGGPNIDSSQSARQRAGLWSDTLGARRRPLRQARPAGTGQAPPII
jgi:branched-subunit amino acid aminotransferase/4-amino-4-deoxychorismate lyase